MARCATIIHPRPSWTRRLLAWFARLLTPEPGL